jgi:type IV pilus assembly protein PilB
MEDSKIISTLLDRLGNDLVEKEYITRSQLEEATQKSKDSGIHLGESLIALKFLPQESLNEFLEDRLNIPTIDLEDYDIDMTAATLIEEKTARKYRIMPLFEIENVITVAMADPFDIFAIEQIEGITDKVVEPVLSSGDSVVRAIDSFWGAESDIDNAIGGLNEEMEEDAGEVEEERIETKTGTIARLVDSIIQDAVSAGASDIHVEPQSGKLRIRFRIDGVLHHISWLDHELISTLIKQIKYMTNMDVEMNRNPQDGKIHMEIESGKIDLRVSTYPTVHGEKVVLSILHPVSEMLDMEKLGFDREVLESYRKVIGQRSGLVLVTGPAGSGKTTTLYSTMSELRGENVNITTIEDPVEYEIEGINQGQVNEQAGLDFTTALRSIVGQDTDIILVGEMSDRETAELEIKAALTGHLVFGTLHTNTAAGAITRLIDMDMEPFLLASTLRGVLCQRLVRRICPQCRAKYTPDDKQLSILGKRDGVALYRGKGCDYCRSKGYRGRRGIFELLAVDDSIRDLIMKRSDESTLQKQAVGNGMKPLREAGFDMVLDGETTMDEVLRVC